MRRRREPCSYFSYNFVMLEDKMRFETCKNCININFRVLPYIYNTHQNKSNYKKHSKLQKFKKFTNLINGRV